MNGCPCMDRWGHPLFNFKIGGKMLFCIVGPYKCGKSVSAGTFPKPMLYFDFDGGSKSIFQMDFIQEKDKIKVLQMHKEHTVELSFELASQKNNAPSYAEDSLNLITKFNAKIKEVGEEITKTGKSSYQTLVIDPLSVFFRTWKETCLSQNNVGKLRQADYLTLEENLFSKFLPTIRNLSKHMYVVLIDHTQTERDEETGIVEEFPVGPSKNMGRAMGQEFDEIYYQAIQGDKYYWRTRKYKFFNAGSRLNIKNPIEANFDSLQEALGKVKKRGGEGK